MRTLLFILIFTLIIPAAAIAQQEDPVIEMQTSKGTIVIELDMKKAPVTAANFKKYVEEGFYDGTVFHRVIQNFMIQGGGMTADMKEKKTRAPIENEANNGLKNDKYTIAMARTQDPHSASSQFFINTKDNGFLNHTAPNVQGWGYCVFGKVIEGFDVVDAIEKVRTGNKGFHQDVPVDAVEIIKVTVRKAAKAAAEKTAKEAVAKAKTPADLKPAKKAATQKAAAKKTTDKPVSKAAAAKKTAAAKKAATKKDA